MKILINERLSEHISKTAEGYLICEDSVLARTGKQQYRKGDFFPQAQDADETIEIDRPEEEVFNEKSMESIEGKPLVIEHPDVDIDPTNYKEYAVGHVFNVRKSDFEGKPVVMGNIMVTDKEAIDLIESGKMKELSLGYDCNVSDEPYTFTHIRVNHIALCERGRAGIAHIQDSIQDTASTILNALKALAGNWKLDKKSNNHYEFNTADKMSNYTQYMRLVKSLLDTIRKENNINMDCEISVNGDGTVNATVDVKDSTKDSNDSKLHKYEFEYEVARVFGYKPEEREEELVKKTKTVTAFTIDEALKSIPDDAEIISVRKDGKMIKNMARSNGRLGHGRGDKSVFRGLDSEIKDDQVVKHLDKDICVIYDDDAQAYYFASNHDMYVWLPFDSLDKAVSYYRTHKSEIRNSILDSVKDSKGQDKMTQVQKLISTIETAEGKATDALVDEPKAWKEFKDVLSSNGYKVVGEGKTLFERHHISFESKEKVEQRDVDKKIREVIAWTDILEEKHHTPTTYSIGVDPTTGKIKGCVDIDKKYVKDSVNDDTDFNIKIKMKSAEGNPYTNELMFSSNDKPSDVKRVCKSLGYTYTGYNELGSGYQYRYQHYFKKNGKDSIDDSVKDEWQYINCENLDDVEKLSSFCSKHNCRITAKTQTAEGYKCRIEGPFDDCHYVRNKWSMYKFKGEALDSAQDSADVDRVVHMKVDWNEALKQQCENGEIPKVKAEVVEDSVDVKNLSLETARRLFNEVKITQGQLDDVAINLFEKQYDELHKRQARKDFASDALPFGYPGWMKELVEEARLLYEDKLTKEKLIKHIKNHTQGYSDEEINTYVAKYLQRHNLVTDSKTDTLKIINLVKKL